MVAVNKIMSSVGREYKLMRNAYQMGARCNQIHNKPKFLGGVNAVYKKVGTAPTVGVVIGTFTPIPGGCVLGFTAGKMFQKMVKFIKNHCLK